MADHVYHQVGVGGVALPDSVSQCAGVGPVTAAAMQTRLRTSRADSCHMFATGDLLPALIFQARMSDSAEEDAKGTY